jgi:hypothetical protein
VVVLGFANCSPPFWRRNHRPPSFLSTISGTLPKRAPTALRPPPSGFCAFCAAWRPIFGKNKPIFFTEFTETQTEFHRAKPRPRDPTAPPSTSTFTLQRAQGCPKLRLPTFAPWMFPPPQMVSRLHQRTTPVRD